MSAAKYTPGPWSNQDDVLWNTSGFSRGAISALRETGLYKRNDDGSFVPQYSANAIFLTDKGDLSEEEYKANIDLVIAAPLMHIELLRIYEKYGDQQTLDVINLAEGKTK